MLDKVDEILVARSRRDWQTSLDEEHLATQTSVYDDSHEDLTACSRADELRHTIRCVELSVE
jgi:hypothetical protein